MTGKNNYTRCRDMTCRYNFFLFQINSVLSKREITGFLLLFFSLLLEAIVTCWGRMKQLPVIPYFYVPVNEKMHWCIITGHSSHCELLEEKKRKKAKYKERERKKRIIKYYQWRKFTLKKWDFLSKRNVHKEAYCQQILFQTF